MDSDAFEQLVHEHQDAVYRQMLRVCNHREDAEDALASALLLAFKSLDQLDSQDSFRAWLSTIGRRVCSRMRSHPKMLQVLEFAEEIGLVNRETEDGMDMSVLKGCVNDALNGLPDTYREIYQRCELDEESVPEASKALGISHAAGKSRLLRARALVRESLAESICGA